MCLLFQKSGKSIKPTLFFYFNVVMVQGASTRGAEMARCKLELKVISWMTSLITTLHGVGKAAEIEFLTVRCSTF